MLLYVSILHSFLWQNDIRSYRYNISCLSDLQLTDTWAVSTFLDRMNNAVMNTHVRIFGWIYVFNSLKLGEELLGHMVTLCLTLWRTSILFSKVTAPFFLPVPTSSHLYQCLLLSISLVMAILVGVKWYLTVAFYLHFLMTNDVEHLYVLTGYLSAFFWRQTHLRNVYSKLSTSDLQIQF